MSEHKEWPYQGRVSLLSKVSADPTKDKEPIGVLVSLIVTPEQIGQLPELWRTMAKDVWAKRHAPQQVSNRSAMNKT
jgi:hypothetical protein